MVDHPKSQKTAENRGARNPVERAPPWEYLFILGIVAFVLHHLRIFSGIYLTTPKPYANYVAFDLHKIKERSSNRSLSWHKH